ncbi:MAG: acyltransferase [Clostridia bacterium]|nr:acyltransferase [Clostridia bacterium]
MQVIKKLLRKIIYKEDASSESLQHFLREKGAQIGKGVIIYAPNKTLIDKTTPWLLKIGDNVRITEGVKILTHDYSWSVLKCYSSDNIIPGEILGAQSAVEIGNNVFIGMNAVITRGVTIGDNVIIGAGSVVAKNCESNSVYAGVPAKRIMSIEDYYSKRKSAQFEEAKDIAVRYKNTFGVEPDKEVFNEYFMLFSTKEEADSINRYKKQMETSMNYDECAEYMLSHKPMFSSYEEFLKACYKKV